VQKDSQVARASEPKEQTLTFQIKIPKILKTIPVFDYDDDHALQET
jgi:hypothetical protein